MEKIVITGYGIKAPGINNKEEFKENLKHGISTLEVLKGAGPNDSDIVVGAINNEFLTVKEQDYKRYPRVSRLAMATADDALEMAGLDGKEQSRFSLIMGTATGGIKEIENYAAWGSDIKKFPIHAVTFADPHTVSSAIARHLGIQGQVFSITTGCTASSDAISLGKMLLESGQTDVCIVGGADAALGQWSIFGFSKIRQIKSNKKICETGVPFSDVHDGFVMAEGAGVLVLEREEHAIRRGATIYGVIEGIHSNSEGLGMFQSDSTGNRMYDALKQSIGSHTPTYVNSQALGLKANDKIESIVHQRLFGQSVPITSIKGMFGHTFGAMGAIQVISSLLSIENNFIPPTLNTKGEGFEGLPIVFETKYVPVEKVAITTHGNGGNNTCLLISKY